MTLIIRKLWMRASQYFLEASRFQTSINEMLTPNPASRKVHTWSIQTQECYMHCAPQRVHPRWAGGERHGLSHPVPWSPKYWVLPGCTLQSWHLPHRCGCKSSQAMRSDPILHTRTKHFRSAMRGMLFAFYGKDATCIRYLVFSFLVVRFYGFLFCDQNQFHCGRINDWS